MKVNNMDQIDDILKTFNILTANGIFKGQIWMDTLDIYTLSEIVAFVLGARHPI